MVVYWHPKKICLVFVDARLMWLNGTAVGATVPLPFRSLRMSLISFLTSRMWHYFLFSLLSRRKEKFPRLLLDLPPLQFISPWAHCEPDPGQNFMYYQPSICSLSNRVAMMTRWVPRYQCQLRTYIQQTSKFLNCHLFPLTQINGYKFF